MSVSKSFMCNLPSNNLPDDPKDPNKHLYDVDDETTYVIYLGFSNSRCFLKGCFLSVITLSDWYHDTALNLESKAFVCLFRNINRRFGSKMIFQMLGLLVGLNRFPIPD